MSAQQLGGNPDQVALGALCNAGYVTRETDLQLSGDAATTFER